MADDPPLSDSEQAVKLRQAATRWGTQLAPRGDRDDDGRRLNKELLTAALAYANAVFHAQPVIKQEAPTPKKKPIASHPYGPGPNGEEPIRWECVLCGRDKFTRRAPHKCNGQYRKRHLRWRPIYG